MNAITLLKQGRPGREDVDDLVPESLEEHHVVKWTLSELDGMDPAAERFDAKKAAPTRPHPRSPDEPPGNGRPRGVDRRRPVISRLRRRACR